MNCICGVFIGTVNISGKFIVIRIRCLFFGSINVFWFQIKQKADEMSDALQVLNCPDCLIEKADIRPLLKKKSYPDGGLIWMCPDCGYEYPIEETKVK